MAVGVVQVRDDNRFDLFAKCDIQAVIVGDRAALNLSNSAINPIRSRQRYERCREDPELIAGIAPRTSSTVDSVTLLPT